MYFLRVSADFSAALYLSDCGDNFKNMHGHDFKVSVTLNSETLENGMVYDYNNINSVLQNIVEDLDNSLLNDKIAFTESNPTVEAIADYIYNSVINSLEEVSVYEVEVQQTRGFTAIFRPGTDAR